MSGGAPPTLARGEHTSPRIPVRTNVSDPAVESPSASRVRNERAIAMQRGLRNAVEALLLLVFATLLLRTFVGEAYLVASGSMAPALRGIHKSIVCPDCATEFAVGMDEADHYSARLYCPSCYHAPIDARDVPYSPGDRVLVQKGIYEQRSPHRWELVVFRRPEDAGQAYIKRVVGLPTERIEIFAGDVYANGAVVRKNMAQFQAMCIPVHQQHPPNGGSQSGPQWHPRAKPPQWKKKDDGFTINQNGMGWLVYQQRTPDGLESAVLDQCAYNGLNPSWSRDQVTDLMLTCLVDYRGGPGHFDIAVRISRHVRFVVRIFPEKERAELWQRRRMIGTGSTGTWRGPPRRVRVAHFDRQFAVRISGSAPFRDYELEDRLGTPSDRTTAPRPFAIFAVDVQLSVNGLRIDRDVFYSSRVSEKGRGNGVHRPYLLVKDEYYVLGDNSPISSDSRVWEHPAVPRSMLLGKPVLVYLPTRTWSGDWLGFSVRCALPVLNRIRRIP